MADRSKWNNLGGEDVRVVSLSDRTLDVTVLEGHEMEDLRIGSVGGELFLPRRVRS